MNNFRNLNFQEEKLKEKIKEIPYANQQQILKALAVAKKNHQGQTRDEGDPYVIHPIRLANSLIYNLEIKNSEMIAAALLHDVVEDTPVTIEEIEKEFGNKIKYFVQMMTREKYKESKKEKCEKIMQSGEEIKLIKAVDYLDNLRSLRFRNDRGERWQRHLREAVELNIPLAKATGNKWLIEEMEKAYEEVKDK